MNGVWLIASRVVQGGGGALLAATSAAIVTAVFPPQERGKALGINVMAVYIGLAVGPVPGGQIVDHLGWRWIFFVNIPIGQATFAWLLLLLQPVAKMKQAPHGCTQTWTGGRSVWRFLICLLWLLAPLAWSGLGWWGAPAHGGCRGWPVGLYLLHRARDGETRGADLDLLLDNRRSAHGLQHGTCPRPGPKHGGLRPGPQHTAWVSVHPWIVGGWLPAGQNLAGQAVCPSLLEAPWDFGVRLLVAGVEQLGSRFGGSMDRAWWRVATGAATLVTGANQRRHCGEPGEKWKLLSCGHCCFSSETEGCQCY